MPDFTENVSKILQEQYSKDEGYSEWLRDQEEPETYKEEGELENQIIRFFQGNPSPADPEVHDFADTLGIDEEVLEAAIYKLLGSLVNLKGSHVPDEKFDPEELKMGIEIEKEHHDNPMIAKAITKAHLLECKDYNSRLRKMEEEYKKEVGENTSVSGNINPPEEPSKECACPLVKAEEKAAEDIKGVPEGQ